MCGELGIGEFDIKHPDGNPAVEFINRNRRYGDTDRRYLFVEFEDTANGPEKGKENAKKFILRFNTTHGHDMAQPARVSSLRLSYITGRVLHLFVHIIGSGGRLAIAFHWSKLTNPICT